MVYIEEECVVYVERTQTAAGILNCVIDHEDILEDHGTQLLCCKGLKTSSPNTSIFFIFTSTTLCSQVIRLIWLVENVIYSQCQIIRL